MDPAKPSLSSKAPHVNNDGGNESSMEEATVLQRESVDRERLRNTESRETDVVDGTTAAAETNHHHRGSADKHKFSTLGHQRRTKQKVVTDFATVSKGTSAGGKPRAALKQALFNQGVSDKNPVSEERGQLDLLKQALQAFAVPGSLKWSWNEENQGTILEQNWTDLVQSHATMSKSQRHQQEALWEFVHTELTYINKLIIIKDLVIAALINLHQHGFLLEVTPEQLFSNLASILSAHKLFWQEVIYPMLCEVRSTGKPFDPRRLEAGCLQFHERFFCYKHYCWEEEDNLEFTRRQMEINLHFQTYIQWVETHPQCNRMRLGDMQAKPHQRITKYPLLLKAVLRYTQDTHVQHRLRCMLSTVNVFLESINEHLRLKDEELALSISAQRVEGYEVEGINEEIDKHVKEICQFDLTCPIREVGSNVMRKLLLEENLKLRGRKDNKLEVVALLFSDVLLITKVQKKGERLKVVRPPLALDRTHCIALKDGCSFVLVEVGELHSAMNVYIFAASTSESCSTWLSTINQAKETLKVLRETEANMLQKKRKIQQVNAKHVKEPKVDDTETEVDDMETEEQSYTHMASEFDHCLTNDAADSPCYKTTGLQAFLPGGLPDVDYPTNEDDTTDDMETVRESPYNRPCRPPPSSIRRRRPVSTLQDPLARVSNQDSGELCSQSNIKTLPSGQSSNSHRVFKLGSLKPNQGMFLSIHDIKSLDLQTLSESELPDQNKNSSMSTRPQIHNTELTPLGHNLNGHSSLLDSVLERAKEKGKERDGLKRDRNLKTASLSSRCPSPSSSFSTTPSPTPSDGDTETEWGEEEVELTRHRASTVSEVWKEQLVDEDDDEKRNNVLGINVDWPGWCLGDDEVIYQLHHGGEGLLEDISRSLPNWHLLEQDGECSQV